MTLYAALDDLTAAWAELEEKVTGTVFVCEGFPLAVARSGGAVRLLYRERAVLQLTAEEKIEAAASVPEFVRLLNAERNGKRQAAVDAAAVIRANLALVIPPGGK